MEERSLNHLNKIAQLLFDKKGCNILAIDVQKISTLTHFFLIAEGNVDRHVRSMCSEVLEIMKSEGTLAQHVEGMDVGDWVVMDYGSIVVHVMTPAMRERYRLEELWQEGEVVDLELHSLGR